MNAQDFARKSPTYKPEGTGSRGGKAGNPSIVLAVLAVALAVAAVYLYSLLTSANAQLSAVKAELADVRQNPGKAARTETAELLEEVGQLMVLPEGEDPTVATVNDPERLKVQPFFIRAKQGDKVLIYTRARKAILYDPVSHKIVEVAPVSFGNPPETAGSPTAAP